MPKQTEWKTDELRKFLMFLLIYRQRFMFSKVLRKTYEMMADFIQTRKYNQVFSKYDMMKRVHQNYHGIVLALMERLAEFVEQIEEQAQKVRNENEQEFNRLFQFDKEPIDYQKDIKLMVDNKKFCMSITIKAFQKPVRSVLSKQEDPISVLKNEGNSKIEIQQRIIQVPLKIRPVKNNCQQELIDPSG